MTDKLSFKSRKIRLLIKLAVALIILAAAVSFTRYVYLSLRPKNRAAMFSSIAFPTLIIDAGHGGTDGGAVSPNGVVEAGINLDIARRLQLVAQFYGFDTVMTRREADIAYPQDAKTLRQRKQYDQKTRLKLINSTPNSVFISIHQNIYPKAAPFGAQVLYSPTDGSRELGVTVQELLKSTLNTDTRTNRRGAVKVQKSIYLMNSLKCKAILVECGFLSNPQDESVLQEAAYQTKLAAIIFSGFCRNLSGKYPVAPVEKPADAQEPDDQNTPTYHLTEDLL
ncbi:MAG: N-acetylmuramoyl-L-alanine amidase [Oscillospiraceae bacterium]|jgi:N-acetylmuramoyl-L-alanine amidase|nr:N-acetylmuramoyl-L-alanine amidase [Oscillospiraceae bacterium]